MSILKSFFLDTSAKIDYTVLGSITNNHSLINILEAVRGSTALKAASLLTGYNYRHPL